MNIDASHVSWVATANSLEGIPEPILSRFQIFHISKLSTDAMHGVIEGLAKQAIQKMRLAIDISVDQDVKGINVSTRDLKKALLITIPQKYRDESSAKAMHITASDLRPYLREVRESSIGFHRF
jgi:ATP-dependent Lon protease